MAQEPIKDGQFDRQAAADARRVFGERDGQAFVGPGDNHELHDHERTLRYGAQSVVGESLFESEVTVAPMSPLRGRVSRRGGAQTAKRWLMALEPDGVMMPAVSHAGA